MTTGFFLVSKDSIKKEHDVKLFANFFPEIDIKLIYFEDIIAIADSNLKKIQTIHGELDFPDFVFVSAFNLGDKEYHLKSVLRMLEYNGVNCINPADTKEKTVDKLLTNQIVSYIVKNLKIPKTVLITPEMNADQVCEIVGLPLVVKIMHGSSGEGLSLIKSKEELDNLLNIIFSAPFNDQIIAQEAILSSKGKDLRLVIANGEVIDSFIRSNPDDFKSNISTGGSITPFDPPKTLVEDALKIADYLNLKLGSVDFLFGEDDNEFYFCEANSSIGFSNLLNAYENGDMDIIKKYTQSFKQAF